MTLLFCYNATIRLHFFSKFVYFLFTYHKLTIEVLVNESGIVNGIFFQDEMMRKMFEKFPEVLLMNAT
jgi:hypothetical protein